MLWGSDIKTGSIKVVGKRTDVRINVQQDVG